MFDNVLTAIDLSLPAANQVLEKATSLNPGKLCVLHVVEPQYVQYSIDPTFTGSLTRTLEEEALATARKRLAELCAPFGIDEEQQVVVLGRPAQHVHILAEAREADTIVVGSHAQTGWRRLLGSTANAILHGAPVNVLVTRITDTEDTP